MKIDRRLNTKFPRKIRMEIKSNVQCVCHPHDLMKTTK